MEKHVTTWAHRHTIVKKYRMHLEPISIRMLSTLASSSLTVNMSTIISIGWKLYLYLNLLTICTTDYEICWLRLRDRFLFRELLEERCFQIGSTMVIGGMTAAVISSILVIARIVIEGRMSRLIVSRGPQTVGHKFCSYHHSILLYRSIIAIYL